jgi:type I restriction enzyme R subunit
MQVYHWSEVEAFAKIFYLPQYMQNPSDHARMHKHIQPAVDRYKALDEDKRDAFYEKLTAYIRFYSFVSQIIPYTDRELEMLYSFGRFLLPNLGDDDTGVTPHPETQVTLEYYRMEKIMSGAIGIEEGMPYGVKSPTAVGTSKSKDEDKPLSEIIEVLNKRFGTDFTEEDRLFFEQIKEKARTDERVIQTAIANPLDKFGLGIKKIIESLMMQRLAENDEIVTRYMEDESFRDTIFPLLAKEIYQGVLSHAGDQ